MSRHAYLIIAHGGMAQLKRLVRVLDDADNDMYLHIDRKWKDFREDELRACAQASSMVFVKRLDVIWGHYSLIQCEMLLLEAAVRHGGYSYVHMISGVDFCLRPQKEIHAFFDQRYPQEFVYYDREDDRRKAEVRCREYHLLQRFTGRKRNRPGLLMRIESGFLRIQRFMGVNRCADIERDLGKGSNWFSITLELAREVVSQSKFIRKHFRWAVACDEVFLHTVLNRSALAENLYKPEKDGLQLRYNNMRYMDWERGTPYLFREDDYEELIQSPYLFARKFDETVDARILDKLENYINRRDEIL